MTDSTPTTPTNPCWSKDGPTFDAIAARLIATYNWIRLPLSQLPGRAIPYKQQALNKAPRQRGLRVGTRSDATFLYMRKACEIAPLFDLVEVQP